jgi:HSP20 family protein
MDLARRERSDVMEAFRRFLGADLVDSSWLRVEEFVDGGTQVVRVELPGVDPDKDVDISVVNGILRISAKREEREEHKEKGSYRSEFRYGTFLREVALPEGCREEDITASYKDGVLEVRAPVGEVAAPAPTKVPVTRG